MASNDARQPSARYPPLYTQTRITAAQKALHQRFAAAADPASVTRVAPPPDEKDCLCRETVGLTMAELKDKVITSLETLTETETSIIVTRWC